jgi:predicted RNA-binding protein with TRAM domain
MQDPVWTGDTLGFQVGAMGQSVSGTMIIKIPSRPGRRGLGPPTVRDRQVAACDRQVAKSMQDPVWTGDTLGFQVGAMGQSVSGTIAVEDEAARIKIPSRPGRRGLGPPTVRDRQVAACDRQVAKSSPPFSLLAT